MAIQGKIDSPPLLWIGPVAGIAAGFLTQSLPYLLRLLVAVATTILVMIVGQLFVNAWRRLTMRRAGEEARWPRGQKPPPTQ